MSDARLDQVRREFASRIARIATLTTPGLVAAFGTVHREDFVGPGPWKIMHPPFGGYVETPDASPHHLYDTIVVAVDPARLLNNGEPSGVARWMDELALGAGARVLHIGSGVGYYTAILAHAVLPGGQVVGLEVDESLAARAAGALAGLSNVEIRRAAELQAGGGSFDAIFVSAGVTDLPARWLEQLRPGGRLVVPLTVEMPGTEIGIGHMLRVERRGDDFAARFISPVGIFHCIGARSDEGNERLRAAFGPGTTGAVKSLRRDAHEREPDCWLHGSAYCLSARQS